MSLLDVSKSLKNAFQKYRDYEDEEVRQASKRYYGPFLRICIIIPCLDEGWVIPTGIHLLVIAISIISYFCSLGVSSFLLMDDLLLFGIEFHYLILVTLIGTFLFYVLIRKGRLCQALRFMNRLHDYGDTIDITEEEKQELEKIIMTQRMWFIPVAVVVAFTASFMALFGPIIDTLVGAGETRMYINGVYMKSPIPVYIPFEIQSDLMHYTARAFPIVVTAIVTPIICGILMLYIVNCQFLAHHHRLLIISVKTLFPRSAKTCKRIYRRDVGENWAELYDDDQFQSCVTFCMKENIQHHQRMREFFEVMSDLLRLPLLLTFIVGTFVLALALFALTEKTNRIGLLMTSVLSMITEVSMIYIVCFFGEEILELGDEVNEAIYGIEWYYLNKTNRKLIISMQDITMNPFVIKALMIFDSNMDTFSSIINTAYSYFNMLTASSAARNS